MAKHDHMHICLTNWPAKSQWPRKLDTWGGVSYWHLFFCLITNDQKQAKYMRHDDFGFVVFVLVVDVVVRSRRRRCLHRCRCRLVNLNTWASVCGMLKLRHVVATIIFGKNCRPAKLPKYRQVARMPGLTHTSKTFWEAIVVYLLLESCCC